jgi:hypothetical protein
MAILDLFTKKGSNYNKLDGGNPKVNYKNVLTSRLVGLLPKSSLDLDGKKPLAYKDRAPENQNGRI